MKTSFVEGISEIGTGFPTDEGSKFADVLSKVDNIANLTVNLQGVPAKILISAFFNSMMNRLYETDPDFCEAATEITWVCDHEFQKNNIARWLAPYKPQENCITTGIRKLKTPQSVQIGSGSQCCVSRRRVIFNPHQQ